MGYKKQSLRSILVALTVMLMGLFMLCAYHQNSMMNPGVNLSDEDLQFRMELLDMLELEDQDGDASLFVSNDAPVTEPMSNAANEELMALMEAGEDDDDLPLFVADTPSENPEFEFANSQTKDTDLFAAFEEEQTAQNDDLFAMFEEEAPQDDANLTSTPKIEKGDIEELFAEAYQEEPQKVASFAPEEDEFEQQLRQSFSDESLVANNRSNAPKTNYYSELSAQLSELENMLQKRSTQMDSLMRIVKNREARIKDLENRVAQFKSGVAVQYASNLKPKTHTKAAVARTVVESKPVKSVPEQSTPQVRPTANISFFYQTYDEAKKNFNKFNYDHCIALMQGLLENYPNHKQADNCQYWIAECYYGKKEYDKAIIEFQKVFAYDEDDKHDDAQLMIGLAYIKLGQRGNAEAAFGELLENYQYSEYKNVASRYIQNI